jgi:hypothetical protein
MGKKMRGKTEYRSNASLPHREVGKAIQASPYFKRHKITQEVSYRKIVESATGQKIRDVDVINEEQKQDCKRWHCDWLIKMGGQGIVIEVQGRQHKQAVAFGGEPNYKAELALKRRKTIDRNKKEIVEAIGWTFVAIDEVDLMLGNTIETRQDFVEERILHEMEAISEWDEKKIKQA